MGSYAWEMVRTLLALAGVCLLAWAVLRMLARRGFGRPHAAPGARVEVLERVPLDARRALVVVRAEERLLLVGLGESGAPVLVTELGSASAGAEGVGTRAGKGASGDAPVTTNDGASPAAAVPAVPR